MDAKMEQLMRSAQAGRIVHALLFAGPHGTGKRSAAALFARAALCQSADADKPCGVCPACKKCLAGTHPDVHVVAPEKSTIKVEQIRALIERLSLAPYEGGRKIAVIERADRMGESAQNALLKTLESPTGDVLFILLTEAPGALLPTVVSRCLQLRFRCLEAADCARVLEGRGISPERAKIAAALAQGSVGRALEIEADAEYLPLRERVVSALELIRAPEDVARALARMGDVKERAADVLEMMELWARDLMRVQNGARPLDAASDARLRASRYSGSALLQRVMLARRQLEANLSWTNVLESMDFELALGRA